MTFQEADSFLAALCGKAADGAKGWSDPTMSVNRDRWVTPDDAEIEYPFVPIRFEAKASSGARFRCEAYYSIRVMTDADGWIIAEEMRCLANSFVAEVA